MTTQKNKGNTGFLEELSRPARTTSSDQTNQVMDREKENKKRKHQAAQDHGTFERRLNKNLQSPDSKSDLVEEHKEFQESLKE